MSSHLLIWEKVLSDVGCEMFYLLKTFGSDIYVVFYQTRRIQGEEKWL